MGELDWREYAIERCPLFKGIDKVDIVTLIERTDYDVKILEKGELAARQNEQIRFLNIIIDGLVRTQMITKEGNLLEIEFLEAFHPLAPAFIFAERNYFPVDVIALERCVLISIPKSDWMVQMMANEKLFDNFMKMNSNMMVFLSSKIQLLSIKSLRAKLSLYILENTTPEQNSFYLKRTQTQLAEFFGVQRPSLARTLGEMLDEGVITLCQRKLTVVNRAKLERF